MLVLYRVTRMAHTLLLDGEVLPIFVRADASHGGLLGRQPCIGVRKALLVVVLPALLRTRVRVDHVWQFHIGGRLWGCVRLNFGERVVVMS